MISIMAAFFDRVSDFFARHRAHCAEHEIYQKDCMACVLANQTTRLDWIDTSSSDFNCDTSSDTPSVDNSSSDMSSTDNSSSDTSTSDSSSSDSSDFGGFDGGDSGGGGSSGDF
jgi:uncharacterized membrane protein YgcG